MCLSNSLSRLGYLSRRVNGFERLVVKVIEPGAAAPSFSINLLSSSLKQKNDDSNALAFVMQ